MQLTMLTSLIAIVGLTSSSPVPNEEVSSRAIASFYPNLAVNIFTPDKGTVKGDVYVFRFTQDGIQHETTSLLSIPFPFGYVGKQCTFAFAGGWAPSQTNPNAQKVQLYSIQGSIDASDTYTERPARGPSFGSFSVSSDGAVATWDGGVVPSFACPVGETTLAFEVAPEGDFDDVSWPLGAGLAVVVL